MTALITVVVILCIAYGAMVITFWLGIIKLKKEKATASDEKIPMSIVVAFRNEEHSLPILLSSIEKINYPQNLFEVILVNDNSSDNWHKVTEEWRERMPNLKVFSLKDGSGKKYALTFGIENASYNHIITTDADCTAQTDWLVVFSNNFIASNSTVIIGPVVLSPTSNLFEQFQALEHSSLTASTLGGCKMGMPFMASSANLAFNTKQLEFDINMLNPLIPSGDDVFLLHAAIEKRMTIACHLKIDGVVETKPASSIKAFINQRARWASKVKNYKNLFAIVAALNVLFFNLGLIVIASFVFFLEVNHWLLITPFTIKVTLDFLLLNSYLAVIGKQKLLLVYIPLQVIYPFYITFAFLLSLIKPIKWK